jgi:hypothetical protein
MYISRAACSNLHMNPYFLIALIGLMTYVCVCVCVCVCVNYISMNLEKQISCITLNKYVNRLDKTLLPKFTK